MTVTADDTPVYNVVPGYEQLRKTLNDKLAEYNESNAVMDLVLFQQAMEHICRITRIISLPRGNAMLVGVGGSGKQSLARYALPLPCCPKLMPIASPVIYMCNRVSPHMLKQQCTYATCPTSASTHHSRFTCADCAETHAVLMLLHCRLASFICGYEVFQIAVSSSYGVAEFKENLLALYTKVRVVTLEFPCSRQAPFTSTPSLLTALSWHLLRAFFCTTIPSYAKQDWSPCSSLLVIFPADTVSVMRHHVNMYEMVLLRTGWSEGHSNHFPHD